MWSTSCAGDTSRRCWGIHTRWPRLTRRWRVWSPATRRAASGSRGIRTRNRARMLVFVGTYTEPILFGTGAVLQGKGEGIYAYRLDESTATLRPSATTSGIANPSYLAFDASQRYLYAVNELKRYEGRPTGAASAFAVEPSTGCLALLNRQPTHGTDPCHVAVNRARTHLFVANFMSGSVCVLPIRSDGSLSEACDVV